jgi:hypothetical protein
MSTRFDLPTLLSANIVGLRKPEAKEIEGPEIEAS